MNGKGEVSAENRSLVLAAARKLQYVPNSQARALVLGRTKTLGVMVHDNSSPVYAQILRGIEEVGNREGFGVLLYNSADSQDRAIRGLELLRANRVDGVLFTPVQTDRRDLAYLKTADIPFVLLFRKFAGADYDYVVLDNVRAGYVVTKHLLELGHRRIAHIGGSSAVSSARGRLQGYRLAMAEYGLVPERGLLTTGAMTMSAGHQAARRILDGSPRPTAIVAATDLQAAGVLKATTELGIDVPGSIALVGGDDIEMAELLSVPLTTFHQPAREMGLRAAEIMLARLQDPRRPPDQAVFEAPLVVRRSSGGRIA